MPELNLNPRAEADPDHLPPAGGAVTIKVQAAQTSGQGRARFRFTLNPADRCSWASGGLFFESVHSLGTAASTCPCPNVLRASSSQAALVIVAVEGLLVDAAGSPISSLKRAAAGIAIGKPLSEHVKELRIEKGQTQAHLAKTLKVSRSTISRLENGSAPSAGLFKALSKIL